MKINEFSNVLLYSNKNVEKAMRNLVNESANAVVLEVFSDKCYLADHTTGLIYESDYKFDGNVFTFDNFKNIQLEEPNTSLKEAISEYFDGTNVSLAEAYEKAEDSKDTDIFEESLTEALASKNMGKVTNYAELNGINEEVSDDLKNSSVFKAYKDRLSTKPTGKIKSFNWKDAVKVSLIDEDQSKTISKSLSAKAKALKTNPEFKKNLIEAANASLDGDNSTLEELLENNICLISLTESELRELVGLSIITDKRLVANRKTILETINKIISEDELLKSKANLLSESAEEGNDEEDAPEATKQDVDGIVKELEKAKAKAKDEKLIEKISDIIDSLKSSADEGTTDVGTVKEAVEILSL